MCQQGPIGNILVCQQVPIGTILVGQGSKCSILVGSMALYVASLWASRVQ